MKSDNPLFRIAKAQFCLITKGIQLLFHDNLYFFRHKSYGIISWIYNIYSVTQQTKEMFKLIFVFFLFWYTYDVFLLMHDILLIIWEVLEQGLVGLVLFELLCMAANI